MKIDKLSFSANVFKQHNSFCLVIPIDGAGMLKLKDKEKVWITLEKVKP